MLCTAAALGGAGGTLLDLACALEAAAEALVPGPLLSTATGAALLAEHADTPAAKRLLPGVCDGSVRLGLAPSCASLRLGDRRDSVSGTVRVVADAGTATHLLLGASTGERETWFVLPADAVIANQKAIAADNAYLAICRPAPGIYPLGYVPHNHHFLWWAASMEGAGAKALASGQDFLKAYAQYQHWIPITPRDQLIIRGELGTTLSDLRTDVAALRAEALGSSERTVRREWVKARALLLNLLSR